MSNQDKFDSENQNKNPVDYNFLTNTSMGMIPVLNHHHNNSQNLPFCGVINGDANNTQTDATSSRIGNIFLPNTVSSQFQADSGFIERAASLSCFGATAGDFGDMMNPFCAPQSSNPYSRGVTLVHHNPLLVDHEVNEGNLAYNEQNNGSFLGSLDEAKESSEVHLSGDGQEDLSLLEKSQNSNKRKINAEDAETGEVKCDLEPTMETDNGSEDFLKNNRQSGGNGVDSVKKDYIHIRARRGQATNSHSLAERVRREKIGERMKFLQYLVPGCSKVTGKAVMLDEIINYVQSLQRQVEFLSMKLSTVNPTRTDIHFEGLLAKDIIGSQAGSSSIHRMMPYNHQLHPSQAGMNHNIGNYSEMPQRATDSYKEPTSQAISNSWEDELHNVMQLMGYNSRAQDLNGSVLSGEET